MGPEEMKQIADFIDRGIKNRRKEEELKQIAREVDQFCVKFPLYPELQAEYQSATA
jgi:glycine/serine hydroxymethyltransferase